MKKLVAILVFVISSVNADNTCAHCGKTDSAHWNVIHSDCLEDMKIKDFLKNAALFTSVALVTAASIYAYKSYKNSKNKNKNLIIVK